MGFNSGFKGLNWTGITSTLHEDRYTSIIVSHSFLLRIKNVPDKI